MAVSNSSSGKTVILFGAGASKGSGPAIPYDPPLGNELFHKLAEEYPDTWGSLPNEISLAFATNFEIGMNKLWISQPSDCHRALQDMAIYFSGFQPKPNTTNSYRQLLRAVWDNRNRVDVLFSTLNYDCLFDGELSLLGIDNMPPPAGNFPFLKLHGSCNWIPNLPLQYVDYRDVQFDVGIAVASTPEEVKHAFGNGSARTAVMSLFMEGKPSEFSQRFLNEIRQKWVKDVAEANRVVLIGTGPHPEDSHIWEPLATTQAPLFCIGNRQQLTKWTKEHRNSKGGTTEILGDRFDSALDELLLRIGIK